MDELTNQLKALGQTTEDAVLPVTAEQILDPDLAPVLDLDAQHPHPAARARKPRRRLVLGAAAGFIAIAVGSAMFIDRQNSSPASDFAVASQTDEIAPFAMPANDNGWRELRFCESTDSYDIDTGNTFYGAYQFTRPTFTITGESVGLDTSQWSSPAAAPPEIQDAMANQMYLDRGQEAWPICGKFIDGPMVTPVVPQWIGQRSQGTEAIIFLSPGIEEDRVREIRAKLSEILPERIESSMTFVDADAAYAELQQMDREGAENVSPSDMPTSFRIGVSLTPMTAQQVREIDDVFELVMVDDQISFADPPPMKLHIPAIELRTPIFDSASLANLERGAAVLAGHAFAPIIAGYGSVEGAVFARLDELRPGDTITVTLLVDDGGARSEVVRTYEVDPINIDPLPKPRALETLPNFGDIDRLGLTLVSDVAGDPSQRLLIHTRLAEPDLASYGIGPTD